MAIQSSILAWRILMDRGTWRATVGKVTKSQTTTEATQHACTHMHIYIYYIYIIFGCVGSSVLHRAGFSCSCGEQGYSSLQCGLSCCGAQALGRTGFSSCGALAQLLCDMWDPPESRIEPVFPASASGFFITEPLGKPLQMVLLKTVQITQFFA